MKWIKSLWGSQPSLDLQPSSPTQSMKTKKGVIGMTEIELRALKLKNDVRAARNEPPQDSFSRDTITGELICSLIEQVDEFEQYKLAVSETIEGIGLSENHPLSKFIIKKPDPLAEAIKAIDGLSGDDANAAFLAELERRGMMLVKYDEKQA